MGAASLHRDEESLSRIRRRQKAETQQLEAGTSSVRINSRKLETVKEDEREHQLVEYRERITAYNEELQRAKIRHASIEELSSQNKKIDAKKESEKNIELRQEPAQQIDKYAEARYDSSEVLSFENKKVDAKKENNKFLGRNIEFRGPSPNSKHHHKLVVQKTILGDGLSSKNKFVDSHFPNNSFISIGIQKSNQGKISELSKAAPFQFQSGQASRKKSREDVKHIFGETTLSKLPHGNKEARKNKEHHCNGCSKVPESISYANKFSDPNYRSTAIQRENKQESLLSSDDSIQIPNRSTESCDDLLEVLRLRKARNASMNAFLKANISSNKVHLPNQSIVDDREDKVNRSVLIEALGDQRSEVRGISISASRSKPQNTHMTVNENQRSTSLQERKPAKANLRASRYEETTEKKRALVMGYLPVQYREPGVLMLRPKERGFKLKERIQRPTHPRLRPSEGRHFRNDALQGPTRQSTSLRRGFSLDRGSNRQKNGDSIQTSRFANIMTTALRNMEEIESIHEKGSDVSMNTEKISDKKCYENGNLNQNHSAARKVTNFSNWQLISPKMNRDLDPILGWRQWPEESSSMLLRREVPISKIFGARRPRELTKKQPLEITGTQSAYTRKTKSSGTSLFSCMSEIQKTNLATETARRPHHNTFSRFDTKAAIETAKARLALEEFDRNQKIDMKIIASVAMEKGYRQDKIQQRRCIKPTRLPSKDPLHNALRRVSKTLSWCLDFNVLLLSQLDFASLCILSHTELTRKNKTKKKHTHTDQRNQRDHGCRRVSVESTLPVRTATRNAEKYISSYQDALRRQREKGHSKRTVCKWVTKGGSGTAQIDTTKIAFATSGVVHDKLSFLFITNQSSIKATYLCINTHPVSVVFRS